MSNSYDEFGLTCAGSKKPKNNAGIDCMNKSSISDKSELPVDNDFSAAEQVASTSQIKMKQSSNLLVKDLDNKKVFAMEEEEINSESINKTDVNKKNKIIDRSPSKRFIKFDEKIGEGQFKKVYRAYDYDLGREVAWNIITLGELSNEDIENVEKEISILKRLKHERILSYISGWFDDSKKEVIFITEIFSGGSLRQYLNRLGHPRIRAIKQWVCEILSGIKYLHEKNIIHRDIKCDNIFINNDGHIKIGDLGFSCMLRSASFAKSLSGTPEFMAPEVLKGKYGVVADIYSFGLCLLEISTLERPYKECESIFQIFDKHKSGDLPRSLEKVKNKHLSEFIKLCLKKQAERPSACNLLDEEFLKENWSEENNFTAIQTYSLETTPVSTKKKKQKNDNSKNKQTATLHLKKLTSNKTNSVNELNQPDLLNTKYKCFGPYKSKIRVCEGKFAEEGFLNISILIDIFEEGIVRARKIDFIYDNSKDKVEDIISELAYEMPDVMAHVDNNQLEAEMKELVEKHFVISKTATDFLSDYDQLMKRAEELRNSFNRNQLTSSIKMPHVSGDIEKEIECKFNNLCKFIDVKYK